MTTGCCGCSRYEDCLYPYPYPYRSRDQAVRLERGFLLLTPLRPRSDHERGAFDRSLAVGPTSSSRPKRETRSASLGARSAARAYARAGSVGRPRRHRKSARAVDERVRDIVRLGEAIVRDNADRLT